MGTFPQTAKRFLSPSPRPPRSASMPFVKHGLGLRSRLHCFHSPGFLSRDCLPQAPTPGARARRPASPLGHLVTPGTMGRAGRSRTGSRQDVRKGRLFPPRFSPTFPPASLSQVYVSYDYGKSFQKISEKLNFGAGNGSEAVIAQFYHSPADNRRVRRPAGVLAALRERLHWRRAGPSVVSAA